MQIAQKTLGELIPYKNNPRKNDDAVDAVANSIKQFGFKVPIVVDKNNVIVAGHTRYKAAQKLECKSVPCIIADDLTDDQIKAFRLADNKVAELADWDMDLLFDEINSISQIDMQLFGDFGIDAPEFEDIDAYDDFQKNSRANSDTCTCPKCGFEWVKK